MNKRKKRLKKGIFVLILCIIMSFNMTLFIYGSDGLTIAEVDALEQALKSLKENQAELLQAEDTQELRSNSENIMYTEKFSLVTIYRHNHLIKSTFKFKIDVKENNKIEINADGPYRDAGYIWGDDYEIYIYDRYDKQKFYDRVTYGGDVYTDVNSLLGKLNRLDIKVGDNIRIDSKKYNNTVRFSFQDGTYYTNGSGLQFKELPARQHKYAMSRQGFIKQLQKPIIPRGMFYQALLLNVKDTRTGEIVQKKLNFENMSEGRVRFNTGEFGSIYNYTWANDYLITVYDYKGLLKTGVVLRKGRPVEDTIYSVIEAFDNVEVKPGDRISFGTTGNLQSLKLIENSGKYYAEPFLTLFTCTNTNFSNGVNARTEFIITDYGLMETK